MIGMIDPAWKDEVVERAAAAFEPCQNTAASGFEELELNGSAGLLLNDDRACTNPATADEITDLSFNDVASPELTVDREIEHRAVTKPPLSIQPEPDGPDLLWLQRAFAAKLPARVPWAPLSHHNCKKSDRPRSAPPLTYAAPSYHAPWHTETLYAITDQPGPLAADALDPSEVPPVVFGSLSCKRLYDGSERSNERERADRIP